MCAHGATNSFWGTSSTWRTWRATTNIGVSCAKRTFPPKRSWRITKTQSMTPVVQQQVNKRLKNRSAITTKPRLLERMKTLLASFVSRATKARHSLKVMIVQKKRRPKKRKPMQKMSQWNWAQGGLSVSSVTLSIASAAPLWGTPECIETKSDSSANFAAVHSTHITR